MCTRMQNWPPHTHRHTGKHSREQKNTNYWAVVLASSIINPNSFCPLPLWTPLSDSPVTWWVVGEGFSSFLFITSALIVYKMTGFMVTSLACHNTKMCIYWLFLLSIFVFTWSFWRSFNPYLASHALLLFLQTAVRGESLHPFNTALCLTLPS